MWVGSVSSHLPIGTRNPDAQKSGSRVSRSGRQTRFLLSARSPSPYARAITHQVGLDSQGPLTGRRIGHFQTLRGGVTSEIALVGRVFSTGLVSRKPSFLWNKP
jgi:hypothetical protein